MTNEPITDEVSKRICSHMNSDHQDAVILYARNYTNINDPKEAELISISPAYMQLRVDGNNVKIKFDHLLKDSSDAHRTLVAMMKK